MKRWTSRGLILISLSVVFLSGCALPSAGRGAWIPISAPAGAIHAATATALRDNRVLITGLTTDSRSTRGVAELFDVASHRWTLAAPPPAPLSGASATELLDGSVLVAGGYVGAVVQTRAWIYRPTQNRWQATGAMLEPRSDQTATRLGDGRVLVAGGLGVHGIATTLDSAEVYDPRIGRWASAGHLTAARTGHAAVLLRDGRVLIAGGFGYTSAIVLAELYDPVQAQWSLGGRLEWPADPANAIRLVDGRVFLTGGGILPAASLYDPHTQTWRKAAQMPTLTSGALFQLDNGRVLALKVGGRSNAPVFRGELYDPATNQWTVTGILQGQPDVSVQLSDGRILVVGDRSAWLYDPAALPLPATGSGPLDSQHLTVALSAIILLTLLALMAQLVRDRLVGEDVAVPDAH